MKYCVCNITNVHRYYVNMYLVLFIWNVYYSRKKCLNIFLFTMKLQRITNLYCFIFNCNRHNTSGTPEQARPARPRSGLDFQIHEIRDYLVIILEALLLTIGLAWRKSVPASLGDDIGLGVSFKSVCFDFFLNLFRQLSNRNPYFQWFWCH